MKLFSRTLLFSAISFFSLAKASSSSVLPSEWEWIFQSYRSLIPFAPHLPLSSQADRLEGAVGEVVQEVGPPWENIPTPHSTVGMDGHIDEDFRQQWMERHYHGGVKVWGTPQTPIALLPIHGGKSGGAVAFLKLQGEAEPQFVFRTLTFTANGVPELTGFLSVYRMLAASHLSHMLSWETAPQCQPARVVVKSGNLTGLVCSRVQGKSVPLSGIYSQILFHLVLHKASGAIQSLVPPWGQGRERQALAMEGIMDKVLLSPKNFFLSLYSQWVGEDAVNKLLAFEFLVQQRDGHWENYKAHKPSRKLQGFDYNLAFSPRVYNIQEKTVQTSPLASMRPDKPIGAWLPSRYPGPLALALENVSAQELIAALENHLHPIELEGLGFRWRVLQKDKNLFQPEQ